MKDYIKQIKDSLDNIEKLIETPNFIKDFILKSIKNFGDSELTNTGKIKAENIIKAIENIEGESLKDNFQIIYNQTCVLAVSALGATLEEFFLNYVQSNWNKIQVKKEIKVPLSDLLKYNLRLTTVIGKIILEKDNSIKLEDLQSLIRTFEDYFGIKIKIKDETRKNIIFYQQCRHVIVHKNSTVDEDFFKKVQDSKCNIKNCQIGNKIMLDNNDWLNIKNYFPKLIEEFTNTFKKNKLEQKDEELIEK